MDKVSKWKRIAFYLTACLYVADFIVSISNLDYPTNNGRPILFIGFFGFSLIKQFFLYKEPNNEFSKTIAAILLNTSVGCGDLAKVGKLNQNHLIELYR
jgi:hypothetical protein